MHPVASPSAKDGVPAQPGCLLQGIKGHLLQTLPQELVRDASRALEALKSDNDVPNNLQRTNNAQWRLRRKRCNHWQHCGLSAMTSNEIDTNSRLTPLDDEYATCERASAVLRIYCGADASLGNYELARSERDKPGGAGSAGPYEQPRKGADRQTQRMVPVLRGACGIKGHATPHRLANRKTKARLRRVT